MKVLNSNIDNDQLKKSIAEEVEQQFKEGKTSGLINIKVDINEMVLRQLGKLPKVKLHFESKAWAKMRELVNQCDLEVAWHGVVSCDGNDYTVHDILVYPQVTSAAHVESDEKKYPDWLMDLPDEQFDGLRMQGHSHVNMSASPSGTDTDYYNDMLTQIKDFYVFIITNKRSSNWVEIYDIKTGIVYETKDIDITYSAEANETWATEMLETMVTTFSKNNNRHHRDATTPSKTTVASLVSTAATKSLKTLPLKLLEEVAMCENYSDLLTLVKLHDAFDFGDRKIYLKIGKTYIYKAVNCKAEHFYDELISAALVEFYDRDTPVYDTHGYMGRM